MPQQEPVPATAFALEDGWVDASTRRFERTAGRGTLTSTEAKVVAYLAARAGETVPRDELLAEVWGYASGVRTRTVDTTLYRVRGKLELDPASPRHLLTDHGDGYRWVPPSAMARSDALVGRDVELQALAEASSAAGIVTLVGPGGVGKTALLRAALAGRHGLLVSLVGLTLRSEITRAVLVAAGREPRVQDVAEGAARVMGAPEVAHVIGLDNAEQALDACRDWAEALAQRGATVIVTSRQALGAAGETVLPVEPLAPDAARTLLERCIAAQGALAPEDAAHTGPLAQALDGLPLALEIAAPRVARFGAAALLGGLTSDGGGAWLDAANPDARTAHHTSLGRTIEHSWAALTETAQALLMALALGRGPTRMEDVAGAAAIPTLRALEGAAELDAGSLATLRRAGDSTALDALDVVRAYAAKRAHETPGVVDAHARWWIARFAGPEPAALGEARRWRERLDQAVGTLVAIATRNDGPARSARVDAATIAARHLVRVGPMGLAEAVLDAVLEEPLTDEADVVAALLRIDVAVLRADAREAVSVAERVRRAASSGHVDDAYRLAARARAVFAERRFDDAATHLAAALDACRAAGLGDTLRPAALACTLGSAHYARGAFGEAEAAFRTALDEASRLADHDAAIDGLLRLGTALLERGDLGQARAHLEDARHRCEALGATRQEAVLRANLGVLLHELGALDDAQAHLDAAAGVHARIGHRRFEGFARAARGMLALDLGRLDEAEEALDAARAAFHDVGDDVYLAVVDARAGMLAFARGDRDGAAGWWSRARAAFETRELSWGTRGVDALVALAAGEAPPTRASTAFERLQRAVFARVLAAGQAAPPRISRR